jgi:amino acid adenylation domain-containing protein
MIENTAVNTDDKFKRAIGILYAAKQDGIDILLNNGQLQIKVPDDRNIDNDLLQQIRDYKQLLIEFLSDNTWQAKSSTGNYKRVNRHDGNSIQHVPLSFSQERIWFIHQLEGSVQYHSADVLKLTGKLNITALSSSLQSIVNRHDVLRTVIREEEGGTYQYVKEKDHWQLQITDNRLHRRGSGDLQQYIDQLINEPFDLLHDDMLRVQLIILSEEEHILVVTMHHIASDGWSRSVFINELAALYKAFEENSPIPLPPLELQYADYAIWQRQYLQGELLEKKLAYWKEKLSGVSPLQLPTDLIRPAVQSSVGTSIDFSFSKVLSEQLQQLSQQQGTTLFMTLLAAFKVLLYRYSGQEDICVGTSVADRQQPEIEDLIGFFVNTLALRSEVKGELTFTELLQQVKATTLQAYEHGEVTFEKVVEAVVKERDASRSPLFQVMLVLNNTLEVPELRLGDVVATRQPIVHNSSKFDLTFFLAKTPAGLKGTVAYSTNLYTVSTIQKLIAHFLELLSSIVKAPSEKIGKLKMLSFPEEQQLLQEFSSTTVAYPKDKSVVELFEEQVTARPDSVAVVFEDNQLTYRQLNERANQLAHYLRSKGVQGEMLVPLCIAPSPEMIVGMMGIMKAGAAYVPIDPEYPAERINHILNDSNAVVAVTSKGSNAQCFTGTGVGIVTVDDEELFAQPTQNIIVHSPKPNHLAYVIYTSGSTGRPKGVLIEHRNLVDYLFGLKHSIQIDQCASFALVSAISTDLGNTVLYSSLVFGGALHLFSKETLSNAEKLHHYFNERAIDCIKIVPSHWKALAAEWGLLLPAKMLVFGGEALPTSVIEDIKASGAKCSVINHYGPTETTVGKLLHPVNDNRTYKNTIPIGRPFSNTQVYVLTKDEALCPVGVPGELYIGGDGVARGYLNNPDLTDRKFVLNPFKNEGAQRLYRTGDLVKYLQDGHIEFIGRIDEQVKIRGYRIELGEIEAVLKQSGLVEQAVVLARESDKGDKQLVGYIVMDGLPNREAVVSYLKYQLPEYMVPSLWVEMESLPLLPNGKIDKKALPDPHHTKSPENDTVAPQSEVETKLAGIWQKLLEVEEIGINDNFFELGGHSLLAIHLISLIRKQLEVDVTIGDIFDYPTIKSLAAHFRQQLSITVLPPIKIQARPERLPLSFGQERLWFIDQLEGSVQYHRPEVLRIRGELNRDMLASALHSIIQRHEVLRTAIKGMTAKFTSTLSIKKDGNWKLLMALIFNTTRKVYNNTLNS